VLKPILEASQQGLTPAANAVGNELHGFVTVLRAITLLRQEIDVPDLDLMRAIEVAVEGLVNHQQEDMMEFDLGEMLASRRRSGTLERTPPHDRGAGTKRDAERLRVSPVAKLHSFSQAMPSLSRSNPLLCPIAVL
jgi:hypothetical protein